jgi:hypothetical protein
MKCAYSGCNNEIPEDELEFIEFCSYECSCWDACGRPGAVFGNNVAWNELECVWDKKREIYKERGL